MISKFDVHNRIVMQQPLAKTSAEGLVLLVTVLRMRTSYRRSPTSIDSMAAQGSVCYSKTSDIISSEETTMIFVRFAVIKLQVSKRYLHAADLGCAQYTLPHRLVIYRVHYQGRNLIKSPAYVSSIPSSQSHKENLTTAFILLLLHSFNNALQQIYPLFRRRHRFGF